MSGIFVNYRSGRQAVAVESLGTDLAGHFGEDQVFLDVSSSHGGHDYTEHLRERIVSCDALIVVIDDDWLTSADEHGTRLIDRDRDWVRGEIELAIDEGKPVVPVLLGEAHAPKPDELPASVRELAERPAVPLRPGRYTADLRQLIGTLERQVAPTWQPPQSLTVTRPLVRRRLAVTATLAVLLAATPPIVALGDRTPRLPGGLTIPLYVAFGSAVCLLSLLLAHVLLSAFRSSLGAFELELQALPAKWYNSAIARPMMLTIPVIVLILTVSTIEDRRKLLVVVPLIVFVLWRGLLATVRMEQQENDAEQHWPQPLSPWPSQLEIRRAVERIRERHEAWPQSLSREQRDKLRWAIADLDGAVAARRTRAGLRRRQWLFAGSVWWHVYVLWAAGTAGCVLAVVLPGFVHGSATAGHLVFLVVGPVLIAAICLATIEAAYQHDRWTSRRLVADVDEALADVRPRLTTPAPVSC